MAGITVLLVGAVALSWYFSSAVLEPHRWHWPVNATVERALPGEVVLSRTKDSLRQGVYGMDWPAGHAIVGIILNRGSRTITRRLENVNGRLTAHTKVAIEPNVYAGNPRQALGLAFANVAVPGERGPMPAWLIPARSKVWAIVVHGINGSREDDLRIVRSLHRAGLRALLITYREDVGVPASPDGLHHMGLTEWRDLQAAARYALGRGAARLVLVGYSMGGSIVAQLMERSPLARRVAGLVLDAPALDWKAILSFNASEMGLPSFAATPVEWIISQRIAVDWNGLDALRHATDFQLPVLLFHGTADKLVPISTSDTFAKELGGWVTYYRVPGARHVQSWNVDPELYERRVNAFLRRIEGRGRSDRNVAVTVAERRARSRSKSWRKSGLG